jgi:general stress protein YciG
MSIKDRGFASMDKARQREIASKGGEAAHARKAAHQWTVEEARIAGRKGAQTHARRRAAAAAVARGEDSPAD